MWADGFTPSDYTDDFSGTSAAAPPVTGVVSPMLGVAPRFRWREVQNILAASATHTGSAFGGAPVPDHEEYPWCFKRRRQLERRRHAFQRGLRLRRAQRLQRRAHGRGLAPVHAHRPDLRQRG